MAKLWVGRNLRELWESWFSGIIMSRPSGKVILPSFAQKQALKQWVLDENRALGGWTFVTREEECRRVGFLSQWEWTVLAKALSPRSHWVGAARWASELIKFLHAGYNAKDIPFPKEWSTLTGEVIDRINKAKLRVASPEWGEGAWVLGFAPTDCWGLKSPLGLGMVAEKETPDTHQALVLSDIESKYEGLEWCDNPMKAGQRREVVCVLDLEEGIKELLLKELPTKRIFWEGQGARAVLKGLDLKAPGVLNFASEPAWSETELLATFGRAQDGGVSARLDFLRQRAVMSPPNGSQEIAKLLKIERELAGQWEKEGALRGLELGELELPAEAKIAEYAKSSSALFPEQTETLVKRLKTIGALMPPTISRELWLEYLTAVVKPSSYYDGITVLPMDNATGLLDKDTLMVVSEPPKTEFSSLTQEEGVRVLNEAQYVGTKHPQRGYVDLAEKNSFSTWLATGAPYARCICLQGVLPSRLKDRGNIRASKLSMGKPVAPELVSLAEKHRARQNRQSPFGESDYAIGVPFLASCKRWETIITTPELAWYDLLGLKPLWKAGDDAPENLWVGNWVHEALKQDATLRGVNQFFKALKGNEPSLSWRAACARAWGIARGFAQVLAESKTIATEKAIEGVLELNGTAIPLVGRIDRVVELSSGELCIVDFKTGPNSEGLAQKKVAEGDGLQLWLYGRLWTENVPLALCRLPVGGKLGTQVMMASEQLLAEAEMSQIAKTGILGQKGDVWGRFSGELRMPLGAFPVDRAWLKGKGRAQ